MTWGRQGEDEHVMISEAIEVHGQHGGQRRELEAPHGIGQGTAL